MNRRFKRVVKRLLIRTVKPPLALGANAFQMLMHLEDNENQDTDARHASTGEYLFHWHRTIVREVEQEFGRIKVGGSPTARPQYVWGVLNAAYLARALGIGRISAIEFGVAGGNGLVVLETIARRVTAAFGVGIDVYGFDTGVGYPRPVDYRDTPNLFQEGGYPIDIPKLRARLQTARLVLGLVESTVPSFLASNPAPVGFAAFDMSLYSATAKALELFNAPESLLLPRVQCYFGSVVGHTYSDFTADRLAISEFNNAHALRKISPSYGLDIVVPDSRAWAKRIYLAHMFDHSLYGADDGMIRVRDNPLAL
jgi:hypothetical protein